jgi:CheY-like chemotaxis protein
MKSPAATAMLKEMESITGGVALNGERSRILVADDDRSQARTIADHMISAGQESRCVTAINEAKEAIEFWQPHVVFADLMLPPTNAHALLRFIQGKKFRVTPKVIVMSKQTSPDLIAQIRRAGAQHYLVKPFSPEEAIRMALGYSVQPSVVGGGPDAQTSGIQAMTELHLISLILKQAAQPETGKQQLYNLMRMIGMKVQAFRCSLIHCLDDFRGEVIASNDDEAVQGLPLDLRNYPEICEVRRTQKQMVIPNIRTSDLMAPVQTKVAGVPFEMVAVFPVYDRDQFWGVLNLRTGHRTNVERFYMEKFGEICAQIISLSVVSILKQKPGLTI